MKPLIRTAVWTLIVATFCSVGSVIGTFYYMRYRGMSTEVETRFNALDARIGNLEGQRGKEIFVRYQWGDISTTDVPDSNPPGFRIPTGSTAVHEFKLDIPKCGGRVSECWLSDWNPRSEISKFEQFHVFPSTNIAQMRIVLQAKAGASIKVTFKALALLRQ